MSIAAAEGQEAVQVPHWMQVRSLASSRCEAIRKSRIAFRPGQVNDLGSC